MACKSIDISIHPPRVGRDVDQHPPAYPQGISIHPPRVGRDWLRRVLYPCGHPISIHPPRVGRDFYEMIYTCISQIFQSTLPVWGGTMAGYRAVFICKHFNPPSPCGEGPGRGPETARPGQISIHPPRVGRDLMRSIKRPSSTFISIHPPRVGRDGSLGRAPGTGPDFNPPSPCGEGQQKLTKILCKLLC